MHKEPRKKTLRALVLLALTLPASVVTVLCLQGWGWPERPWWMVVLGGVGSMVTVLLFQFGLRFLKGDNSR